MHTLGTFFFSIVSIIYINATHFAEVNIKKDIDDTTLQTQWKLIDSLKFIIEKHHSIIEQHATKMKKYEMKMNEYEMKMNEYEMKKNEHEMKINENERKMKEYEEKMKKQNDVISNISKMQNVVQSYGEENRNGDAKQNIKQKNEFTKLNVAHLLYRNTRQTHEHTAFTVYLDVGIEHLNNGQTLIFNRALYNEGNAFNTVTGTFNCKISGVYLFSLFFGVEQGNHAVMKISIDGSNQVDGVGESTGTSHDVQGGNILITHVNVGQSVWVSQYYENDGVVRGWPTYRFTTFAGVLLY